MHLQEKLRLLQQAGGDTANLVLASVDLAYYGLPETQLAEIREALEACSIPHWCDEQLLATLLDISVKDSKARLSKLRRLGTIERFTARGFSAVNVAEPGRTAIRTRMSTNDPKRFSLLSLKAAKHFGKETSTAGRIESIFNLLSASQREAQKGLGAIIKKLTRDGRYQELHLLYKTAYEWLTTSICIQPGLEKIMAAKLTHHSSGKGRRNSRSPRHLAPVARELSAIRMLVTGIAQASAGQSRQAAPMLRSSLDFYSRQDDSSHAEVIDCRWHLAETLRRLAQFSRAREMIEVAKQLARTANDFYSIQLGLVLNELAAQELYFNNLRSAQPAAEESHRLLKAAGDPRRTLPMDTLARIHCARGRYEAARDIYLSMQEIDAATLLGTDHPRYVAHLHNYSTVLQALGDSAAAIKALKKVTHSIERVYGESHPDLSEVHANLGRLEQNRNRLNAAEQHFERARKLTKKLFGQQHPSYGYDLANLGALALDRNDSKQAAQYFKAAIAVYRKVYDRPHAYTASALTFLAYALIDLNKPYLAMKAADEAVDAWERIGGLCADRAGDAGACDRAFAQVLLDVAEATCRVKGSERQAVVCKDSEILGGTLQKGDIRRRLLAILIKKGLIKEYKRSAITGESPLQQAAPVLPTR